MSDLHKKYGIDPRVRLSLNVLSDPECYRAKSQMWQRHDRRKLFESQWEKKTGRFPKKQMQHGAFGRDKSRMCRAALQAARRQP